MTLGRSKWTHTPISVAQAALADAILDRLMHNAHRIKLKGESLRKTQSNLTDHEHLEVK